MSVTDSIKYRIAENIVTEIKKITAGHGYNHTLESAQVFIAKIKTEIPDPLKDAVLVDVLDSDPVEDQGHTIVWDYSYLLRWYRPHSGDTASINDDDKNAEADAQKSLKVDTTRGGLAHYTTFGECGPSVDMDTGAPFTYLTIICRTTVNSENPYSN